MGERSFFSSTLESNGKKCVDFISQKRVFDKVLYDFYAIFLSAVIKADFLNKNLHFPREREREKERERLNEEWCH